MEIKKTDFNGVLILQPKVLEDARGSFMESYRSEWFAGVKFIQDNEALSKKGVIRGLHFQRPPFAQSKLIRVLSGRISDVIVDLRKSSDTFGQVFSIELSSENKTQLLVPKGFAHGYTTLSDTATVLYKVDQYYNKIYDTGIHPFSESLSIDWQVSDALLSEKDQRLINFKDFKSPF